MNEFHKYNAKVLRVVDGDTIDCMVDLGFNVTMKIRFRMVGYNAPETYRPKNDDELKAGLLATEALKEMIDNKNVIVHSNKFGKYRYLAEIFIREDDDYSVNEMMVIKGHNKDK